MFWVVEYDDFDPPVYYRAADILLDFLQKKSSHPCVHFEYQLESLTHFIKEIHKKQMNLIEFKYLVAAITNCC
jgi:hypothetical protein